ncbi:MAG: hypothetical protein ACT4QC_23175 [Planctomycetaceae bacterium]
MSGFPASRPLGNTTTAYVTLGVTAVSVILAWLIWVAAIGVMRLTQSGRSVPAPSLSNTQAVSHLILTWMSAALAACVVQTGRTKLFAQVIGGILLLVVGWTYLAAGLLRLTEAMVLGPIIVISVASSLAGTAWAFFAASRSGLISIPTLWILPAAIVIGMAAMRFVEQSAQVPIQNPVILENQLFRIPAPLSLMVLHCTTAALCVLPLAASPLAIAWNRHR